MTGRPGEIGSQQPMFSIPGLDRLSPITAPPAPPAPAYPGIILAAGGRDVGAPPAIGPELGPGRAEWESSRPGLRTGEDPSVLIEGPQATPPAPPPAFQAPSINDRGIDPDTFMMRGMEQEQNQQNLDPRGWQQASLLDILQNFNPISTAEARSGRSQAGNLQAPRLTPAPYRAGFRRSDLTSSTICKPIKACETRWTSLSPARWEAKARPLCWASSKPR